MAVWGALGANEQMLREVFGFERGFGRVQVEGHDGRGFEQLEVDG